MTPTIEAPHKVLVSVRLPADLHAQIVAKAKECQLTVSRKIEDLLRLGLVMKVKAVNANSQIADIIESEPEGLFEK